MTSLAHQDTCGGPVRITDLEVFSRKLRIVFDQRINHQPGFFEVKVVENDTRSLAHRAICAVCSDDIAGAQLSFTIGRRQACRDASVILGE